MRTLSIAELYEHFDANLGKDSAKKLTSFIGSEINDKFEQSMKTLATKDDLAKLELGTKESITRLELGTKESIAALELGTKESIARLELGTKESIARLELATKKDMAKLELDLAKLDSKIGETKVDIIKWMFGFWITVMLMFIGLYLKS